MEGLCATAFLGFSLVRLHGDDTASCCKFDFKQYELTPHRTR